ncbi:hypothetical protein [Qipengyuania sp. MTN3-11]|uniref:CC_3452 family protein n=1 Tax=Qipengyuania sp. MTN3-11 TaxID=3056557 RepID=UPI0036F32551
MTLSLPRKANIGAISLALSWTALSFGAAITPAPAQAADGPHYLVELTAPAKDTRAIAGGVAWKCEGRTCVAGKSTSRPLRVCRELQREVGTIATFTAKGEALAAEDLARCNG